MPSDKILQSVTPMDTSVIIGAINRLDVPKATVGAESTLKVDRTLVPFLSGADDADGATPFAFVWVINRGDAPGLKGFLLYREAALGVGAVNNAGDVILVDEVDVRGGSG